MLFVQVTVENGQTDCLTELEDETDLVGVIRVGGAATLLIHVDCVMLVWYSEGTPSNFVAIPQPWTIDQGVEFLLNGSGLPDSLDQTTLLSTTTNENLIVCQLIPMREPEVVKTYVVLMDISVGNLDNLELIDSDLDCLANGVDTWAGGEVGRGVLEFTLVSIFSETTSVLRFHGEG